MAEMETSQTAGHGRSEKRKAKKLSTRVDLTPMVDLGFLLITFFMLTTTMAKPKTMQVYMPDSDKKHADKPNEVKESLALTVMLGDKHDVYYYEGTGSDEAKLPVLKHVTFARTGGIRDVIIKKQQEVENKKEIGKLLPSDHTTVLIKPDASSSYEDVVAILDEMSINDVKVYAIVDINPMDKALMAGASSR